MCLYKGEEAKEGGWKGEGNMESKDFHNREYQDVGGATFWRSAVRISMRGIERGVIG